MGTSAFDKLWDAPKQPQKSTGFDTLWGDDKPDPNAALHAEFKSGGLKRRIQGENEVEQAQVPSLWDTASQVPETVAAGVPGAKLLISAARAKLQGRPMAEVQKEVNAETSDVPYASAIGRLAGAGALVPFLPASGAASGAILGGAEGLLNNEGDVLDSSRLLKGAVGAGIGSVAGKVTEGATNALRAKLAPTASKLVQRLTQDRSQKGAANYGRAADEGKRYFVDLGLADDAVNAENATRAAAAAHPVETGQAPVSLREGIDRMRTAAAEAARRAPPEVTQSPFVRPGRSQTVMQERMRPTVDRLIANEGPTGAAAGAGISPEPALPLSPRPALSRALDTPGVKPYADIVRSSERFQGADDATIAREAFKLMSEAEGKKLALSGNAGEFKAATDFQLKDIAAGKDLIRKSADEVMPSFNPANDTHRIISGEIKAARQGYGMGQKSTPVTQKQLGNPEKDPEAWLDKVVPKMTPEESGTATTGLLGSIKASGQGYTKNPFTLFNTFGKEPARQQGMLRALEKQSGNRIPQDTRNSLLAYLSALSNQ